MDKARTIVMKHDILQANRDRAELFRARLAAENCFMVDVMGSPGAGKTSLLLALIERLRADRTVGVIEADIESTVDSDKMKQAGVRAVQLQTNGVCHVEMGMVERAKDAFGEERFDFLFLENIGNLVCPVEFDTGAHCRIVLLSVPEGYDKVYKYPMMFAVCEALIVTKCDYLPLNPDFDRMALRERATLLNPGLRIFETSARTGEGIDDVAAWMRERRAQALGGA